MIFAKVYGGKAHLLYDCESNPRFLKLYIQNSRFNILESPIQETFKDSNGEFLLVPILLNCWICPFCGNLNFDLVENCRSQNCVLNSE